METERFFQAEAQAVIDSALVAIGPIADKVSSDQMGSSFTGPPGSSPQRIAGGSPVVFGEQMQRWADWVRSSIDANDNPARVLSIVNAAIGRGAQALQRLGMPVGIIERVIRIPGGGTTGTSEIVSIPALAPDTREGLIEKIAVAVAQEAAAAGTDVRGSTMAIIADTTRPGSTPPGQFGITNTVAASPGFLGGIGSLIGGLFSGGGGGTPPTVGPVIPGFFGGGAGTPGISGGGGGTTTDPCDILPPSLQALCRSASGQGGQQTVPVTGNNTIDSLLQLLGGTAVQQVIPGAGGVGGAQTNQELANLLSLIGQGSGAAAGAACGNSLAPVEASLRTKTINKAPCGYSIVTRDWASNGQPFPKAIRTDVAKAEGWIKRRPKPPITASQFKTLKTAQRVEKKIKTLATSTGLVCRNRK